MGKNIVIIGVILAVGLALVGGGVWWLQRKESGAPGTGEVMRGPEIVTPADEFEPAATPELSPVPTQATEIQGGAVNIKKFTVEGSNYKFSPATIKVKKGDTVQLTFKSMDAIHDWSLDVFDAATNQIGEGEEEEIEFVAEKAGTFEFYCSVGNHRQMGMKGKFIVE
ncbi:MAG: Plastocyanin [Candidatus Amesbacteria bacterium GW2011_GWB1_47_19]|nr:MAG: Plastocyanin [Candidatus Amesbacteria bacterium GW2011_GWA1_44_24]KKU31822.1 MAG: Blue (Type 1) copper domain protein [Candidatus Amesbacteria bacterium GW2011_GWC1_46_24]KKU66758.1 MAG: Plastocyanin [Candidatus Amesbacteria bacterium GW2011_GWB1_47_19]OGD05911.1 MAG: hypothetical protein A2379_00035 [Candidatus Amesbacteria bacterium RIFOXYB1_FULL_47_13]HBC73124.1 hypothetical protein [Candidatus Amesbacteria bacterium]